MVEPLDPFDDRPHHLPACGVTEGVDDPVVAVPPFPPQFEQAVTLVELCPPGDQLGDPLWRLAHDRIDHPVVTQPDAGHERVGDMVIEAILWIDDPRDPPLCPLARRSQKIVLRDDGDRKRRVDRQRGTEPGHTSPEDEDVGETVLDSLRTEGDEVPRAIEHLGHSPVVPWV